ncbi:lipoprotein [Streptomyces sp. NPDC050418]|uniref:lipoprotein n=1 Tax=Streptomyces sp. NPDC050418 TaxID=3365612 RepID=UPI0037B1852A
MRSAVVRGMAAAAVAVGLVAGCSGGGDGKAGDDGKAGKGTNASEQASTVGSKGSACELPVTFGIAAKWKPSAIDTTPDPDADGELAETLTEDEMAELLEGLATRGPVIASCEISAKATGKIGFLRTYIEMPEAGADPRTVLEGFVAEAEEHADEKYTSFKAGSAEAVEVVYSELDPLFEERRTTRAFAVGTPEGTVVVALGGSDQGDEKVVLPAYELAKESVRVSG